MPMPRSAGSRQVTFLPAIQTWPASMSRSPAIAFRRVDLPQPEGPSRTMNSPSWTSRSRSRRTLRWPKETPSFLTETCDIGLALHRAGGDAAHEQPPRNEIDGERHKAGEDGRCHVDVVFAHALDRVDDVVELHRHRIIRLAGIDEAEEIVVPDAGHLKDDRHREDRERHRQHDPEEDAPEARAVDARCLEQLGRQRGKIVAEE